MDDRHDRIRQRAFDIWEREGKPGDEPEDHWYRAEREIDEADRAASDEPGGAAAGGDEANVEELEKVLPEGEPPPRRRPR